MGFITPDNGGKAIMFGPLSIVGYDPSIKWITPQQGRDYLNAAKARDSLNAAIGDFFNLKEGDTVKFHLRE